MNPKSVLLLGISTFFLALEVQGKMALFSNSSSMAQINTTYTATSVNISTLNSQTTALPATDVSAQISSCINQPYRNFHGYGSLCDSLFVSSLCVWEVPHQVSPKPFETFHWADFTTIDKVTTTEDLSFEKTHYVMIYYYYQYFENTKSSSYSSLINQFHFTPLEVPSSYQCCGNCMVDGSDVGIFYWKTSASTASISELVDPQGFTFESPSVYLTFKELKASDRCQSMSLKAGATTLAFDPQELSTADAYTWDSSMWTSDLGGYYFLNQVFVASSFKTATWGDQDCEKRRLFIWGPGPDDDNGIYSTYTQKSDCISAGNSWTSSVSSHFGWNTTFDCNYYTVTQDPCFPSVALPPRFMSMFPNMTGCTLGVSGFFDPPSALVPGTGFSTVTPANSHLETQSNGAVPGATPYPTTAAATQGPNTSPKPAPSGTYTNAGPSATNSQSSETHPGNDPPSANHPNEASDPPSKPLDPTQITNVPPPTAAPKFIIGSLTLTPGGLITMSGVAISLQSDGLSVIEGAETLGVSDFMASAGISGSLVIGGETMPIVLGEGVAIAGTTIPLSALLAGNQKGYVVLENATIPVSDILAGDEYVVIGGNAISLSAIMSGNGNIIIDGITISMSEFLRSASVVAGGKSSALSALLTRRPVSLPTDASVAIGTHTVAFSTFLAGIRTAGPVTGSLTTNTQALGAIIAGMGGLIPSSTLSSSTQGGSNGTLGNSTLGGAILVGGGSHSRLDNIWMTAFVAIGTVTIALTL